MEKVVVVTGASSGIGRSLAIEFARNGYNVVAAARKVDQLETVKKDIEKAGGKALIVATDVSKESDCERLMAETMATFGRIDVLINNAGISMRAVFEKTDLNVIRQLMDINFWGTVYCTKYALPHLLKSKGSVVGISSIAGKKGLPGRTGYSASKFAMEGFLETLRTENLKTGLHVLVACPGFTASNIRNTALAADGNTQGESPRDEKKMMQPEEVARRIYKAVEGRKRDIIMTRDGKLTVFLNKFFPAMMDKVVYNHMAKEPDSPFR
ncbi:MAG: SDR family oxidoreductase [Bacteroidetes bacterium]|nr:SDR family oxidoreductase [Bacteroidota bacterium]